MVRTTHDARRLVDLSHTIEHGTVTLKGFPAPIICDYLSREASRAVYAEGTEFHIGRIDMIANTGTYVDAPFHRYADGKDLSELPLEWVADLEGVVVRATERAGRGIGAEAFAGIDVAGKAVLVHTGHAAHWGRTRTSRGTRSLPAPPPSTCATRAPAWWASTRSTLTTRAILYAPCTRCCSARRSRWQSTCAGWSSCRTRASASSRCR
jgi:kynurenine formamidase